jgi:glyoxylase-like metal-dependent hydrolase (beta-lactamase superfamily II)
MWRMQLEDHAGDIVHKSRSINDVSLATAAQTAGVSEAELTAFEASGQGASKINFTALAPTLGLNPQKLMGIAGGWLPSPKNLSGWPEIRSFTTAGDGFTVNCYLIWDPATRDAALFDTGLDAQPVLDVIAEEGLALRHIFITHSHWDHVEALPKFRAAFPKAQLHSSSKNAPANQRNQAGESVLLGQLKITHRETPGHAEDGVTYLIGGWPKNAPPVAVVGDTIFAGSMGNGNGAWELAKQRVRAEILSLPGETLICPGHGPLTTVAEEKAHNPFY